MTVPETAVTASLLFLLLTAAAPSASANSVPLPPYTNCTVGGAAGWFFDPVTDNPATNYSAWAARLTFYLGDFLIFKTNSNMSVIQTYNATTYGLCSLNEDYGNLTSTFDDGTSDGAGGVPGTVPVELTAEGDNYYFSDAGEGLQCRNGMRFHILVGRGRGLPADSNPPPPQIPPDSSPAPPKPSQASTTTSNERLSDDNCAGGGRPVTFLLQVILALQYFV